MNTVVRFEAPWDGSLSAITIGAIALVLAVTAFVISAGLRSGDSVLLGVTIAATLPGLLSVFGCYCWSPRAYAIGVTGVRIERLVGAIELPLSSIREVQPLDDTMRLKRVFGVGGVFGYYGTYSEAELGNVKLYATRSAGRVALVTAEGTVVVTPEPPGLFVSEVRSRL
jgi:hypothetical protein